MTIAKIPLGRKKPLLTHFNPLSPKIYHALLPKEWGTLIIDTDTRKTTLTNLLRGALCFSTD